MTTTPGSTSPTLFEQWCGFFYVPQEPDKCKCCETGPTVFRPYPRRLESLTVCRCHYKGSTFSSVIFKTLSVGPARVRTRDLPLSTPALYQGGGMTRGSSMQSSRRAIFSFLIFFSGIQPLQATKRPCLCESSQFIWSFL